MSTSEEEFAKKLASLRSQFPSAPVPQILKFLVDSKGDENLAITKMFFAGYATAAPESTISPPKSPRARPSPFRTPFGLINKSTQQSQPQPQPQQPQPQQPQQPQQQPQQQQQQPRQQNPGSGNTVTRNSMSVNYSNAGTTINSASFIQRVLEANKIAYMESELGVDLITVQYLHQTHHLTDWGALYDADMQAVVNGLPDTVQDRAMIELKEYLMFLKQLDTFFPRVVFGKIQKKFQLDHMTTTGEKLVALSTSLYHDLVNLEKHVEWMRNLNASGKVDTSLVPELKEEKTKIGEFKMALQAEIGNDTLLERGAGGDAGLGGGGGGGVGVVDTPHIKTEIVLINDSGNLETNKALLKTTAEISPELPSRTVVVVGNTGVGKSTLIRNLTPVSSRKPAVALQKDAPVSVNVHLFDTKWEIKIANENAEIQTFHTDPIRILDVEGLGAYAHILPTDLAKRRSGIPDTQKQTLAKRRWNLVQQFPRLCFAISDVIVYVVNSSMAQDIVSILHNFVTKGQQKLGRAWTVDLIIVFNKSDYASAQKTMEEVTAMWKEIIDKDDNFLSYTFNSIDCIALPLRESPEAYKLWYERINDLKVKINQKFERRSKYDRGQWCRLVNDVVHKFNGVIDPSKIIAGDASVSTKTLRRCYWKFDALQQYMQDPNGAPPTKDQFIWVFKAIVSLYAMFVADKTENNVLMRPTNRPMGSILLKTSQPSYPSPTTYTSSAPFSPPSLSSILSPLPTSPDLSPQPTTPQAPPSPSFPLSKKLESKLIKYSLKKIASRTFNLDELIELRDLSRDIHPAGLPINHIDSVHKKLYKLTFWLGKQAPCAATNKLWVGLDGKPVRCIQQQRDHDIEGSHRTTYHLMERIAPDLTVLERVAAKLDSVFIKILAGTRFKKWTGVWEAYKDMPSFCAQIVALYWEVYNKTKIAPPSEIFRNIATIHEGYPSTEGTKQLHKLPPIDKCFICLINTVSRVINECGHTFCNFCVMNMKIFDMSCPLCHKPLVHFDMSMHILSTNIDRAFEEVCFTDFVKSISIDSPHPLLDGYTIVSVVGNISEKIISQQFPIPQAGWTEWDYFLHFLGRKVSTLKGHHADGTETPAWTRRAIYKSKNILFLHWGCGFTNYDPTLRMLSVLSHYIILLPDEGRFSEEDAVVIESFPTDYPQLTGRTPPRIHIYQEASIQKPPPLDNLPKISPVIFAHSCIEMLSVEKFEPETGVLLISSITKSLYQLLPRLSEFFPVQQPKQPKTPKAFKKDQGESSLEVVFGSKHATKLLEKFLLKTCIIQIVDVLLVRHSQPKGAFCFFEWTNNVVGGTNTNQANHVNTIRDILIVHCAMILKQFYDKKKILQKGSEVDHIIADPLYPQKIIAGCFKRPGGRYGFPSDIVLTSEGNVYSWFPIVAHHSNLRGIEVQFGKQQFERFTNVLKSGNGSTSQKINPVATQYYFCSLCIKLKLTVKLTEEKLECGHILCSHCSEGLEKANDKVVDNVEIDTMLCPVCCKLSLQRASSYVMTTSTMTEKRIKIITSAINEGLIDFDVIEPTLSSKSITGKRPNEAETVTKVTFSSDAVWKFHRAVGLLQLLRRHPNIVKLKGAYGPSVYSVLPHLTVQPFMMIEKCPSTIASASCVWLTWPRAATLLRDVANAIATMHKIGWLCNKFTANDIGVFNNEEPPRAVLMGFSYVCPANPVDQRTDDATAVPSAVPLPELSLQYHTKESDIFYFGQLMLLVCMQVFGHTQKAIANWTREGISVLPTNFPVHVRNLISSTLHKNAHERPSAQDVHKELNQESADCEISVRYARVHTYVESWLKSEPMKQGVLEPDLSLPQNKLLKSALSEFHLSLKASYEEKMSASAKSETPAKDVMYKITCDIREVSTMIANLYDGNNPNLKSAFYFMRDFVEREIFELCSRWYTDAYHKEFMEDDQHAVEICQTETYSALVSDDFVSEADAEYFRAAEEKLLDMSKKKSPREMIGQLAFAMKIVEKSFVTSPDATLVYLLYTSRYPTLVSDAVGLLNYFSNYDYNAEEDSKVGDYVTALFNAQEHILKLPYNIVSYSETDPPE